MSLSGSVSELLAIFRDEIQFFHTPPLFHLEFRNDFLGS